jgi:hypothetical protein
MFCDFFVTNLSIKEPDFTIILAGILRSSQRIVSGDEAMRTHDKRLPLATNFGNISPNNSKRNVRNTV